MQRHMTNMVSMCQLIVLSCIMSYASYGAFQFNMNCHEWHPSKFLPIFLNVSINCSVLWWCRKLHGISFLQGNGFYSNVLENEWEIPNEWATKIQRCTYDMTQNSSDFFSCMVPRRRLFENEGSISHHNIWALNPYHGLQLKTSFYY